MSQSIETYCGALFLPPFTSFFLGVINMTVSIINGTSHQINLFSTSDTLTIQNGRKLILRPLGLNEDDVEDLIVAYQRLEEEPGCFEWQQQIERLSSGGFPQPVKVIPPGTNLNAVKQNLPAPQLDVDFVDFLLKGAVVFEYHDPIPQADIVIVSNLFRSAVKELGSDTSRLATVDGVVYKDGQDLRPCGCTALAVG